MAKIPIVVISGVINNPLQPWNMLFYPTTSNCFHPEKFGLFSKLYNQKLSSIVFFLQRYIGNLQNNLHFTNCIILPQSQF